MILNIINDIIFNLVPLVTGDTGNNGDLGSITFDLSLGFKELPLVISLTGYVVVFVALVILIGFVSSMTGIIKSRREKKLDKEYAESGKGPREREESMTGEVNAAIATALHLYFDEMHDEENTVITILRQQKAYRPWSSKLYSLTQNPVKQSWKR